MRRELKLLNSFLNSGDSKLDLVTHQWARVHDYKIIELGIVK
jgi:hypothetical protein